MEDRRWKEALKLFGIIEKDVKQQKTIKEYVDARKGHSAGLKKICDDKKRDDAELRVSAIKKDEDL